MTISYVGSGAANATTIAIPSHQQWDLIVVYAYRNASALFATVPAGWIVVSAIGSATNSIIMAFRRAASSSETSGTWTNADQLAVGVYRSSTKLIVMGNNATGSGTSGSGGTITYGAISLPSEPTNRWLIAGSGHRQNNTDIEVAPTGLTARASIAGGSVGELAVFDSNGNYTSWASTSYTLTTGTSSGYKSAVAEIVESTIDIPVSSGGGPLVGGRLVL